MLKDMKAITLSPAGKQPVRIASMMVVAPDINVGSKKDHFAGISKKVISATRNILRAAFCDKAILVVAALSICAMWWHLISITDTVAAVEAVATDCLYAMPWCLAWLAKRIKKGGEA